MKAAVLCVEIGAIESNSNSNQLIPGIYDLNIKDIPANMFNFLNRRICDSEATMGLHHDIARELPQLLVYATVQNEYGEYLSYTRANGGEARLNDLRSIGIGGHTDIDDVVLDAKGFINAVETLEISAKRELAEEIGVIAEVKLPETCKIITNFQDPASSVHVGVWMNIVTQVSQVQKSEEIPNGFWITKEQLIKDLESYEPWSQLIIKSFQ